jgi:hypothetical protein
MGRVGEVEGYERIWGFSHDGAASLPFRVLLAEDMTAQTGPCRVLSSFPLVRNNLCSRPPNPFFFFFSQVKRGVPRLPF